MGSIYQLTFFLAIALLAIVITVFVLAVSLLGRAVRLSTEEQEKAEKERKEDTEKEIVKIQGELDQAKKGDRQLDIDSLGKSLQDLKKQDKKHERRLKLIKERPRFLKARWGALIPGAFFIASIIFSGFALGLLGGAFITSLSLWGAALITIGIGIYLIYQSLTVIEGVAVTSEEAALSRETEALKLALREVEDEKKPKLELTFEDAQPPFHVTAESEMLIRFHVALSWGDIARNAVSFFFAPPSFAFLDSPKGPRSSGKYANYVTTQLELGDITKPLHKIRGLKFKAPSEASRYTLAYNLLCEGFYSGPKEFEIVVEEVEIPF